MKLVIIGIVVGILLAAACFLGGMLTASKSSELGEVAAVQTALAKDMSDVKAKLESMDTKLDILVKIATAPVSYDVKR